MMNPAFTGELRTRAAAAIVSITTVRGGRFGCFPNGRTHTAG